MIEATLDAQLDAFVALCVANAQLVERVEPEHVYVHRLTRAPLLGMTTALREAGFISGAYHAPQHAARGRFIHDATLLIDGDDLEVESVPAEWRGYCTSYERFVHVARPRWLLRESVVANLALGVGGTLDRFGYLFAPDGRAGARPSFGLVDFKAGSREKWHRVQTAGYVRCLPPNCPLTIQRWCLYLHADGRQATLVPHADRRDDNYFLAAVSCCRFKQE